jgi:hypothetical protein
LCIHSNFFLDEAERLLAVDSLIDEDDNDSARSTIVDPAEERLACHASQLANEHGMKLYFLIILIFIFLYYRGTNSSIRNEFKRSFYRTWFVSLVLFEINYQYFPHRN